MGRIHLQCRGLGFTPWVRKMPWRGHGNPLQYACLQNSMGREAGWATVHKDAKSWTTTEQLTLSLFIMYTYSVQFSHSVMSDSLWLHRLQHTRPPCPSPTPGIYPNSCPLSRWCHPIMSSSVVPFSSCPKSLPASGSFQMRQLFTSGGQNIG